MDDTCKKCGTSLLGLSQPKEIKECSCINDNKKFAKMANVIDEFRGKYSFLSNFSKNPVTYKGIEYMTSEHAYQAMKARTEDDRYYVERSRDPGEAKKRGREIEVRDDWEDVKYDIMVEILREKFKNKDLKQKLIDTGDSRLVEGNRWHDNYWGVCKCYSCRGIPGQNHLGEALMEIRKELLGKEVLF